jgi:hypothetical protein
MSLISGAKRYMSYRYKLETWIKYKVYKPIAEIQGFYRPVNGEISTAHLREKEIRRLAEKKQMQLIIPEIRWQQQDLTSNQSSVTLIQSLQQKGLVSTQTILSTIGLDPETEKKNLESERGSVFDPNAPKTGPLPSEGPGNIPAPDSSSDSTPSDKPVDVNKEAPSKKEDFSFPEKKSSVNDFFEKRAEGIEKRDTLHPVSSSSSVVKVRKK